MVKFLDKLELFTNLTPKKNLIIFFILIFLCQIAQFDCGTCTVNSTIKPEGDACFNNVMLIYGRSGQFHLRNDGVLLVEFSSGGDRIFFGLKPNGRGAFENDSPIYFLQGITNSCYYENDNKICVDGRYESKNRLVSLEGDTTKKKQYLFSVSTYISLTELHYFDEDFKNTHKTWLTTEFFNIDKKRYIFSYQFSLVELPNNIYIAAYVQYEGTYKKGGKDYDYSISYKLTKFKFTSPNDRTILCNHDEFKNNFDDRIVSAFYFEHYNNLAVIFLKNDPFQYTFRFHDLDNLDTIDEKEFYGLNNYNDFEIANKGQGLYFKALYLQYQYFAIVFFTSNKANEKKNSAMVLLP